MGAFGQGLGGSMQQYQGAMAQKSMMDLMQQMQQGQMGRMMDPGFAAAPNLVQGPVAPVGGVSLKNKLMSSMRGIF